MSRLARLYARVLRTTGRRSGEPRDAPAEEQAALWPRLVAAYEGNERYRAIARRELPVVVLEPTGSA
jgi:hypothetical protein